MQKAGGITKRGHKTDWLDCIGFQMKNTSPIMYACISVFMQICNTYIIFFFVAVYRSMYWKRSQKDKIESNYIEFKSSTRYFNLYRGSISQVL